MEDRRLMGLWVSPHFFDRIVKVGHVHVEKSPIPRDAVFQGAYWIPEQGEFLVVYFSSDFAPVPEGQKIPTFDPSVLSWESLE